MEEEACGQEFDTHVNFRSSFVALLLTIFQDSVGRKKMIQMCFLFASIGIVCLCLSKSLEVKMFGLMLLWAYMGVVTAAFTLLSNELVVNPVRNVSIAGYGFVVCLGGLLGNLLTGYIATYEALMIVNFVGYLVWVVMVSFLVPESPSFLLMKSRFHDLRQVIDRMMDFNRLPEQIRNEALQKLNIVIDRNQKF